MSDPETPADATEGRFLVTHAEDDSAVLKDVDGGQVHTLSENPGVEAGDALEATVAPDPPMEVTWRVVEVASRRRLTVEVSEEPPTAHERDLAPAAVGDVTRTERAGEGEIHVLTVPEADTEAAVADVRDDEATLVRAARLGVNRVEIRHEAGLVSVRYLP
jgi:hypothetical protein